jgi:hypothetical protein
MRGRWTPFTVILLALALIGFGQVLRHNLPELIIIIVLVGLTLILYRYPPKRYRQQKPVRQTREPQPLQKRKTKPNKIPFRVIEGRKPDKDDPPKYH